MLSNLQASLLWVLEKHNLLDRDDVVYSYEYYDLPFNWTLTYTHTF